ncbi:unnamed protein product [Rotaria magnacalcarata]
MNANKAQSTRYIHDVDDKKIVTIKFACNSEFPKSLENYFLEVALITVLIDDQYYLHPYKFQLDNANSNSLDENPFKLVTINTLQHGFIGLSSLLNGIYRSSSESRKTIKDLKNTYELSRATLPFSLGYSNDNKQLFRFTNTTVMLNKIIEKKKAETIIKKYSM